MPSFQPGLLFQTNKKRYTQKRKKEKKEDALIPGDAILVGLLLSAVSRWPPSPFSQWPDTALTLLCKRGPLGPGLSSSEETCPSQHRQSSFRNHMRVSRPLWQGQAPPTRQTRPPGGDMRNLLTRGLLGSHWHVCTSMPRTRGTPLLPCCLQTSWRSYTRVARTHQPSSSHAWMNAPSPPEKMQSQWGSYVCPQWSPMLRPWLWPQMRQWGLTQVPLPSISKQWITSA